MAQQNIDFGSFPDDPDADAIRTAFQKVQHNFTEVYGGIEGTAVSSIIAGAGIDVSSPTGNVIVTANIACVQVHTSTLSIGRDSNGAQDASLTQSSQTLWVDLPANISNVSNINLDGYVSAVGNITGGNLVTAGLVSATGNVSGGNVTTSGTVSATTLSAVNLGLTGNITAIGNMSAGNISATTGAFTNVSGNGSSLSSITGANVTGQVANALVAGTVYTAAQPNITSVGTLTSLAVTGNISAGNVTATTFTGSLSGAATSATTAGTVTTAAQPNITSVGTLTSLGVAGNVTAGNVYANSGTIGASLLTGTLTTAAQPNVTSLGTLSSLDVSGNITAANITANTGIFSGNGYGLTNLTGANVTGTVANATYATSAGSATTAGTVTTAAQPNITSTGTLTGLTVNGTVDSSGASNVTLGSLTNIHISGGSSGYTIKTDGAGNLSWGVDTAAAGGSNSQIQFNDNNTLNASANLTFDTATNLLTVTGNIQATNANLGNSAVANYFTGNFYGRANTANTVLTAAQPNITSLGTLTGLTVGGTSTLGDVGNVKITGGTSTTYLQTDGTGNLTWASLVNTPPGGSANSVQYKDGSAYQGSGNLLFNDPELYVNGTLNVVGNASVANLTATNLTGTLTTGIQTNITRVGTLANLTIGSGGFIIVNGYINAGNISGNIVTANYFTGDGSNLSGLTGANISGAVGLATYATTANAVAGANVSGAVGLATYATTANAVAGANVSGAVSYATVANAVAGANVSGQVSYAAIANSVAGVNVSGIVANASYATIAGTATTATTASTVTSGAQSNITSVGTLTSLTVSGATSVTGNSALTVTNITSGASSTTGYLTGNWILTSGSRMQATYADLAELYSGDEHIEPGTVVEFGGSHEVQMCNTHMSTLVAGIVTTDPAYIMNANIDCEYPVAIALQGRIPAKVIGPVKRGDMMVSSLNGYAMACSAPVMGSVLGKALTNFDGAEGVIEIMVGRT